jgi:chromosome partition protein MukB
LVNWRSVFYEHYALDEHVTALEGANGAGKTTVMIAAFIVLLPDMTRLRFTNVGEGEATGGDRGIHGRLGKSGRPSYAVIEFELGSERLLAGVRLEPKAEPSVELTPFIITELPRSLGLQELLLLREGEHDLVPEFDELRENAARLGARFHRCPSIKDYFAILFERGITPLRLASDEDRYRFGDMLRTSMTGGISRALTADLRSFLLKEERGLADTLVRMRENLDACRRTRGEVQDARNLEQEISGVFQAGHSMFSAALAATRERAEEQRRKLDETTGKRDEAVTERDRVLHEREREAEARERIAGELREVSVARVIAEDELGRCEQANKIVRRLATHAAELERVANERTSVSESLQRAQAQRDERGRQQQRAEQAYAEAADGLANLQTGLDQLHRRASSHRMVKSRLAEVCELLGVANVDAEQIDAHREKLSADKQQADVERGELDERIAGAQAHRRNHTMALDALALLTGEQLGAEHPHTRARTVLAEHARLAGLAEQLEDLGEQLAHTQAQLDRQLAAIKLARSLERTPDELGSQTAVKAAVRDVNLEMQQQRDTLASLRAQLAASERELSACDQRQRQLEDRASRWRELDRVAARLEHELAAGLRSADELDAARDLLDEHADSLRRRRDELSETVDRLHGSASMLEHSGGAFPDELLAARDSVEGQLLAGYFEDIEPDRAARVQAQLGPLAEAIVVEDAQTAASQLRALAVKPETIWLLEGPHAVTLVDRGTPDEPNPFNTDIEVVEGDALRITQIPKHPTLGRKARLRRLAELRTQIEQHELARATTETALVQVSSRRSELTLLLRELETLIAGDPADALRQLDGVRRESNQRISSLRTQEHALAREQQATSRRAEALHELLAEAHWLDLDDLQPTVTTLAERRREAQQARDELLRTRAARATLNEFVDALRLPPLSDADLAELQTRHAALGLRRQALFSGLDALAYVAEHREALAWTDAEAALDESQALLPALRRQHEHAREQRDATRVASESAQADWSAAQRDWHEVDGRHQAIREQCERTQRELTDTGVEDPSDAGLERARARRNRLRDQATDLDIRHRAIDTKLATLDERLRAQQERLDELQEQLSVQTREWQPSHDRWERLRSKADADGLISTVIAERLLVSGAGSVNLNSEAHGQARALLERLSVARGGDEILERIRAWVQGQEQAAGENYLQAWSVVRDWIRRRVPAQVAEVDDPLEALERLRHRLVALDARLARDEDNLRGTSEDIANGINVHIRAAHKQVKRLNATLEGVHFGTIQSMKIRLERKPDMERVLDALRKGPAQELLFFNTMPIEQALEQLFSRGGGGRTGGQKLLDYREYLTITVEILRQAEKTWERVNPSRVSTGEAIGIGAALMMVVLTAWERDANLLRAKRSLGTLRFLFLDEANRLSRDNLEVLFDLCKNLDLQLLIAAPEVAQAQGCTTYRLVRRKIASGQEEVLVSGRRVRAEAGD